MAKDRETPSRVPGYKVFDVVLERRYELSPSMARLVFTGPKVDEMTTWAPDQRIKVLLPSPDGRPSCLPESDDWLTTWRGLAAEHKPPMRTYTIRAIRPEAGEVDVDFVLHGDGGPASAWAIRARHGDRLQLVAPNAHSEDPGGYEWRPPAGVQQVLLIADETALPAAAGILEQLTALAAPPRVQAFIEIPSAADALALIVPPGSEVTWLDRHGQRLGHGQGMLEALEHAWLPSPLETAQELAPIDLDQQLCWEIASSEPAPFYAWVAGESNTVVTIRRELVRGRGLDKRRLSAMGYWREGKAAH